MKRKCNHDVNSPKTSIELLPEEFMVFPPQKFGFCPVCQKIFKFQKENDNTFILIEEGKTNDNE